MAYYNSTSPRQHNATPNTYVNSNTTYISSPFDDDPPLQHSHQSPYNNPYNPDYAPASPYSPKNNTFNQTAHSTQEHSLSPGFSEKALPLSNNNNNNSQSYPMQPLTASHSPYEDQHNNNRDSYYGNNHNYYNGYDEDRPSLSNDTAPMRPYSDMETSEGLTRSKSGVTRVKYGKEKSKYLPCFPCIRSTCGRVTCCICLLLLLIIIALVIVVFTVFKLPTVNYLGMDEQNPTFQYTQGQASFSVNFHANIEVKNPNPIGFNFESIVATAYYPNYDPSIGGGNLTNVDFPAKSTKTIKFPIYATYDGSKDTGFKVVKDILTKCGKLGGDQITDLTINYDLKLTIKIIGINISPTIKNQHANFACPADLDGLITNIPGGLGAVVGAGN